MAAALVSVSLASVASAETIDRTLPIEKSNPGISKSVVDALPDVVKNSSVKISADFQPGTPIFYPDGKLVPGQTEKAVSAAAACTNTAVSTLPKTWGPVVNGCTAIFGRPGLQLTYSWQSTTLSRGVANKGSLLVRGYHSGTAYWKSGGSNIGREVVQVTVDWGNMLAPQSAQAYMIAGYGAFTAHFWH